MYETLTFYQKISIYSIYQRKSQILVFDLLFKLQNSWNKYRYNGISQFFVADTIFRNVAEHQKETIIYGIKS